MALTPQQISDKWARNLSAAATDAQNAVQNLQENPMQKAIAKKQKFRNNLIAAIDSGKWEAGLNAVQFQDWKNAYINKGVPRMSQGANEAKPKMQAFMTALLPYQQNLKAKVDAMPDLTLADSGNRMLAWMNGMADFQYK